MAKTAEDVIMVISSLCQDINHISTLKPNAIRTLGQVIDPTMVSGVERIFKQYFTEQKSTIVSSALVTALNLFFSSKDAVKRWSPEIQSILTDKPGGSLNHYHALGLLYLLKQNDHVATQKAILYLLSKCSNPFAAVTAIKIYSRILDSDSRLRSNALEIKPLLKIKERSEAIAVEAARLVCRHPELYSMDVPVAVQTLQSLLRSPSYTIKLASLRILHEFAELGLHNFHSMNVDVEGLTNDANRNVATMAMTMLLKTGTEQSIDRLFPQLSNYLPDISEEFKIVIVDSVTTMAAKFPSKSKNLLKFLGETLREDGGVGFKKAAVIAIIKLIEVQQHILDDGLAYLCEFIEDCEYPTLTALIVGFFGDKGLCSQNPTVLVRFIFNRLALENSIVRRACVSALGKLGTVPSLRGNVSTILRQHLDDPDDEVRDRASFSLRIMASVYQVTDDDQSDLIDFSAVEAQFLDKWESSKIVDIRTVPILPRTKNVWESDKPEVNEGYSRKESDIVLRCPDLKNVGDELSVSDPLLLTSSDSEYLVNVTKHIFRSCLVLDFEIVNTLPDIVCKNLLVNVDFRSSFPRPNPVAPLEALFSQQAGHVYCIFDFELPFPHDTIDATLHFDICELDHVSGKEFNSGFQEHITLPSFELSLKDFILPRQVMAIEDDWETLPFENVETLEIPDSSVELAALSIEDVFGLKSSKCFRDSSCTTIWLTGQVVPSANQGSGNFAVKTRLISSARNVIAEIAVRSSESNLSKLIITSIC